ncbi:putative centromere binding protein B [Rosellinia necatrix]|uniref:Putative centromere binding protein B n=1 Tax=Rosellinia necatrix TaxID=77044 RepID=A0A1W2TRI2_ROSNE|nr:putative centromere binding protein B [Rosellinia necatrix]
MHNNMITSTSADQDDQLVHDASYSNNSWVGIHSYGHMPMANYQEDYYMQNIAHGLPSEPLGGHLAPSPFTQNLQPNSYQSQLPPPPPPLIPSAGQVPWPSLQTNPSQSYQSPPVPIPSVSAPPRQQPKLPTINTSQPRRTLTDQDRREMCKFADENPGIKQHDIGLRFGVERSTVSKVLRRKDQYLNQEDRSASPVKKNKGKSSPDIERALANWVRGQQKKGVVVNDYEMEEKAKVFCTGSDIPLKTITTAWIEKFKQKHGMGPGRLIRRASETAIPDSTRLDRLDTESPTVSNSQTPSGISPASPAPQGSPLVSSATSGKAEDKDNPPGFNVSFASSGYKNPHSQSTTSLNSAITDPPSSTFSGSAFSPASTSQFTFSPDPNTGMFGDVVPGGGSAGFHRPRSQTVPSIPPLEYINPARTTEPLTPKYSTSGTGPSSAIESPVHEMPSAPFGLDAALSPRTLHHASSSSSLAGRSNNSGNVAVTVSSTPTSPTQDDARRAADTLLSFMQHQGWYGMEEYMMVLRLGEKLGVGGPKASSATQGLGVLSRIPEGDVEMMNGVSALVKHEAI